jgi:hypothetical protein
MYTTPPSARQQILRQHFVDTLTDGDPTHDDTQCNGPLLVEPDPHQRETWDIQQSRSKAHTYPLTQEDLPVLGAQAEHHNAEHDQEVAHNQHDAKVA